MLIEITIVLPNHHRQQPAGKSGIRHTADRAFDEIRRIDDRLKLHLRTEFLVDPFHFLQNAVGHLHGVGAGLLVNLHHDARLAVHPHIPGQFFMGVDHFGDVADFDQFAVLSGRDHGIADLVDVGEDAGGRRFPAGVVTLASLSLESTFSSEVSSLRALSTSNST